MLHLLVLSMALADTGTDAGADTGADTGTATADPSAPPPAAPAPTGRAPTVRVVHPSERSSFGSLRMLRTDLSEEQRHDLARGMAMAFGGVYGGYAGGATAGAAFGDDNPGLIVPAALVGAGVGGLAGMTLAKREGTTPDGVMLVGTTATYGAFLGYEAGRGFIPVGATDDARRIQAAGVLGSVAGLGAGLLLADQAPSAADLVRVDMGLSVGFLAGTAINHLRGLDLTEDRQARAPITFAATTAFGGAALGLSSLNVPQPGVAGLTLGVAQGGWIGLWTPTIFGVDDVGQAGWAGLRLGVGAGYLASYGVAAFAEEPDPTSVSMQFVGMGLGSALGAGVPLLVRGAEAPRSSIAGLLVVGSVLGQTAGAVVAPRYSLSAGDGVFVSAMGAWTGWQSAGWAAFASGEGEDNGRAAGAGLTVLGAGGLTTLLVAPAAQLTPEESALLLSAGAWGSALTALTGVAANVEPRRNLGLSLGVGDLALAGTAVALAGGAEPSWGTVARVNGGLAVGGALGALGTVIFAYDSDSATPAATATLVGSAVGLTGALLLPRRAAASSEHAALNLEISRPHPPVAASWSISPWTAEDGSQGAQLNVQGAC